MLHLMFMHVPPHVHELGPVSPPNPSANTVKFMTYTQTYE